MIRLAAFTLTALLIVGLAYVQQPARTPLPEHLFIEPRFVLFDGTDDIEDVASIQIANRGPTPIRVLEVTSSCGCTLADPIEQPDLEPGATTLLRIRGTPPTAGERRAFVDLECDLPQSKRTRIEVHLKGKPIPLPSLKHSPETVFIRGPREDVHESHFEIETIEVSGTPDWLGQPTGIPAPFEIHLEHRNEAPSRDAGQVQRTYRYQVRARIQSGTTHETHIALHADGTKPVTIKVIAEHIPALRAVPAAVFWQIDSTRQLPVSRQIALVASNNATPTVTTFKPVRPAVNWLDANVIESTESAESRVLAHVRITITALPDVSSGHSTVLTIETNHPDCPRIDVPIVIKRP